MNQKNPKKQYNEKLNQPKLSQFSDTKFDKKIEKNKQSLEIKII